MAVSPEQPMLIDPLGLNGQVGDDLVAFPGNTK